MISVGRIGAIEDNIPLPDFSKRKGFGKGVSKYPWNKLATKQSFLVELQPGEEIKSLRQRVRSACNTRTRCSKKVIGQYPEEFVVDIEFYEELDQDGEKVPRGVRVWRVK